MNVKLWISRSVPLGWLPRAALLLVIAIAPIWSAGPVVAGPARLQDLPDLTISEFGQLRGEGCAWGDHWHRFRVTVTNVGTASAPPGTYVSLAIRDWHTGPDGRTHFGGSLTAVPVPDPGSTETVTLGVGGYADYRRVVGVSPHPFRADVDWDNKIDELDEDNNVSAPIWVAAPGCLEPR